MNNQKTTKTKRQLRAEAVERLRECRHHTLSDYVRAMLGWGHEPHFEDSRDALIDLLTDDDSTTQEDDSTAERDMTNLEWLYEHDGYLNSFAKLMACLRGFSTDEFTANEWLMQEHSEPNPDCSAMLYWMYTENMKHEPCSHYEPKDDVSGYGADFNVVEPNFDNIKAVEMDASRFEAVEMDASRLVVREPDSREKLEADVRKHYAYSTTTLMYPPSANKTTDMLGALPVDTVIGWLDRQEAITKREWCDEQGFWNCAEDAVMLSAQVVQLTAERDEVKKECIELHNDILRVNSKCDRYRLMCSEMATKIQDAQSIADEGLA